MEIKTAEGTQHVASSGVGGTALGLGIAGTIGLLNQMNGNGNGNGFLNGLLGGGNCNGQVAALQAEIAKLESERYTDSVGIELYKQTAKDNAGIVEKINNNFNITFNALAALDKQVAVSEAVNVERARVANERISALEGLTKTVIPTTSICPEVMPRYNSWTAPAAAATTGG